MDAALQAQIDAALQDNLVSGACCGSGTCTDCTTNCLRYSTFVAQLGVFYCLHETSQYANYSNTVASTDCVGRPITYSTLAGKQGIFSSIIITNTWNDYVTIPNQDSIDSNGYINQYNVFVAKDAIFFKTIIRPDYYKFSSICELYDLPGCTVGPTGPRGIRGFTGPTGTTGYSAILKSVG